MEPLVFNFWAILRPAQDVPGQWVAHALEFDVVTQGDSFSHAAAMLQEAVAMVLIDDLRRNKDPHDRRAPGHCWQELAHVLANSVPASAGQLQAAETQPEKVAAVVAQMFVRFDASDRQVNASIPSWDVPLNLLAHSDSHC